MCAFVGVVGRANRIFFLIGFLVGFFEGGGMRTSGDPDVRAMYAAI